MARRVILSAILIVLLLGGAGAVSAVLIALRTHPAPIEPTRPALTVTAIQARPATIVIPLAGYGTARAERVTSVGAEVAGVIVERPTDLQIGATVAAGDVLLRIDARDYEAELQRARGQLAAGQAALRQIALEDDSLKSQMQTATEELAVAEREYARVLDLLERGASNPRELDAVRVTLQQARRAVETLSLQQALIPERRAQQEAQLTQYEAAVTRATTNLARCTVTAPFGGRIAAVHIERGEQVAPGTPLVTILDPARIEIPLELPLSNRPDVHVGAAATLRLESNPTAEWTGAVTRISPQADEQLRTFPVFVEVVNRDTDETPLMPGMFVTAEIAGPRVADALLIPRYAVRKGEVFLARDGLAQRHAVEVRRNVREQAIVRGLAAGDIVITSNLDALYDGAPVSPLFSDPDDAGPLAARAAAPAHPVASQPSENSTP